VRIAFRSWFRRGARCATVAAMSSLVLMSSVRPVAASPTQPVGVTADGARPETSARYGFLADSTTTLPGDTSNLFQDPASTAGSLPATPPPGLEKIQHFVFIMQENRSFDSYFGTYPGADGLPPNVCLPSVEGTCVAPFHQNRPNSFNPPHDWTNVQGDINGGRMNGFVLQAYQSVSHTAPISVTATDGTNPVSTVSGPTTNPMVTTVSGAVPATGATGLSIARKVPGTFCASPTPVAACRPGTDPRDVVGWYDSREIPNYWNYAHLYVLQDHMFASAPTFTLPNRLFMLAGQSGGYLRYSQHQPSSFNFPEITERLSRHGVSWNYYVTSETQILPTTGEVIPTPATVTHGPDQFSLLNPLPAFPEVANNPAARHHLVDTSQFYTDARTGRLPAVSWVVPSMPLSEHPPYSVSVGMAYVTGLVNAVMAGPDWSSTAIFISYDESGGFYDHVQPPLLDGESLGPRVPGLVISPYARQGYVDHQSYSVACWLRLIEERYGVPPLTTRDATAADMLADFDFSQPPRPPILLSATVQGTHYPVPGDLPPAKPAPGAGTATAIGW
jgi:phospholipase C